MQLNPIITGSTGMIGKGLLLECLEDPNIDRILVINRHPLEIRHEKLKEIIHNDFFDLTSIKEELKDYSICYFCLGISAAGLTREVYTHITHDLTLSFAKSLLAINPDITFCYISGAGTDSSEKGRVMWARVKGRTENDLLALGFKKAWMLRPALILPRKGVRSRTRGYNIIYTILRPFYPLLKYLKKYVTDTERLGRAMIRLGLEGFERKILENTDLDKLID
jgi:uncharacterized protein YbjT (DUF2867 family)